MIQFYGISAIVGYLMPDTLNIYVENICDLIWFGFMALSTIISYLMPYPLYSYILIIYDLVWLDFMAYQPL